MFKAISLSVLTQASASVLSAPMQVDGNLADWGASVQDSRNAHPASVFSTVNVGAGNIARARKVAWTAGILAACVVGSVGIVLAIAPDLWAAQFTSNPQVLEAARQYFHMAGPAFGFLGLALSLYFSSQGSGKILGPVLAQSCRLIVVALGGFILLTIDAPGWSLFLLAAASMVVYGLAAIASVWFTEWEPSRPAPKKA